MTRPEANVTAPRGGEAVRVDGTLLEDRRPPERTCVGCGRRDSAHQLVRIAVKDGHVVPDPDRRLGGRGAWLHPAVVCLDEAVRRRAFTRALRADAGGVAERLAPIIESQGLTATR